MDKTLYDIPSKNAETNLWLCFPAIRSFGMSSLGYMSIVKMFDKREDYYVEKVFTDTESTAIPSKDVDLIGFSVSFEMDFLGILKILENQKIPFKTIDRDDSYPLVFGGGPVLTANPEPYADLFDFIIIGDAENMDKTVFDVIKAHKHLPKQEILRLISELNGIYVPSIKQTKQIEKISAELGECIATPVLSEESFFKNTYVIEIVRGCPQRCGFCLASYLNLPVRFCSFAEIKKSIDEGLKHTNKLALLGALISAHPQFEQICQYIIQKREQHPDLELSVSSLRADSVSPDVIKMLVKCGQNHSTIAIEAATDRLRKVINKNLTEEQIFKTVQTAQENGLKGLKLYAMTGLPTETEEDLAGFVELAKKLKSNSKGFDFTFSFGSFVPKAHTPFQFCKREDTKTLEKKYEYLKKEFHKIGVKIRTSSVKWDFWQAVLSRGDRRLCDFLIEVYKNSGSLGAFKQCYKEFHKKGILPSAEDYGLSRHEFDEVLPWDFLKIAPGKEFLIGEHQRLFNKN